MDTKEYQTEVKRTMGDHNNGFNLILGLVGEAGEVAELIKKLNFYGGSDKKGVITTARMMNELGDVLWYLTAMIESYGMTLEQCMEMNVKKLRIRFPNGFTTQDANAQRDGQS